MTVRRALDELDLSLAHLSETIDRLPDIAGLQRSHDRLLSAGKMALLDGGFENTAAYGALRTAIAEAEKLS